MKNIKTFTTFLLSATFILVTTIASFAATFTVTNVNDSGAGSLRQAVLEANAAATDDMIEFDSGVFSSPQTITLLTGEMFINRSGILTINGPGANLLSISGNDQSRIFNIDPLNDSLTVTINAVTIRNGFSLTGGGGGIGINIDNIANFLVRLNVNNSIIRDNEVESGAAGGGSGIKINRPSELNMTNSLIKNNTNGPAVLCGGCSLVNVINTVFEGNDNGNSVTFLCCPQTTPIVNFENTTFINNSGGDNGSAFRENNGGTYSWKNVTIAHNSGTGGAVRLALGDHTFENVTIAYNLTTSVNTAGGVSDSSTVGSSTKFRNSIVARNTNPNGESDLDFEGPILESLGYNLFGVLFGSTSITGDTTGNQLGVDPLLDFLPRNNGGITKTLGLRSTSPAIDSGDPSNFLPTDQRGISRPVDGDENGSILPDIGAFEKRLEDFVPAQTFDFDGDAKSDISIFRPGPNPAQWWILRSSDFGNNAYSFGLGSDTPVPADYTGDGKTDVAFFRESSGEWFVLRSEDNTFYGYPFGTSGDIPAPGDFDGDGMADTAIYRPSNGTWYINRSSDAGTTIVGFGISEDKPTVADYDGDGMDDIAIYRPSVSQWWLNRSTDGTLVYQFGQAGDKTVHGDHTGDGKADVAFWRPGTGEWFVIRSEDQSFYSFPFGASTDLPIPGDYDGDGQIDAAVLRPSTATWFLNGSTSGTQIINFGFSTDIPLANSYVYE